MALQNKKKVRKREIKRLDGKEARTGQELILALYFLSLLSSGRTLPYVAAKNAVGKKKNWIFIFIIPFVW